MKTREKTKIKVGLLVKKRHRINKRMKIEEIGQTYKILAIYLFGSMANEGMALLDNKASGKIDPLADLDVGIVFMQAVTDPKERIKIYGRLSLLSG